MTTLRSSIIRLAHSKPDLRSLLLGVLKTSAEGQYYDVKDLPDPLARALKAVKYGKKDIRVVPRSNYSVMGAGEDGFREFVVAVNLITGAWEVEKGSWGGANMFTSNAVDLDARVRPLPPNGAIIKGSEGGGKPVHAVIYIHPDNLADVLPAGTEDPLTEDENKALQIVEHNRGTYRAEYFNRHGLGVYGRTNPVLLSLAKKGLLKLTGTGVVVTTQGKNLVGTLPRFYE